MNRPHKSRTLVGHATWVTSVAISPDGTWLASGCDDGTIGIWDTVKGRLRKRLTGHALGVEALAISPDGAWLASIEDTPHVYLWNHIKGRLQMTINTGDVWSASSPYFYWPDFFGLAASPDGTWLATVIRGEVEQWDIASGHRRRPHVGRPYSITQSVAISPDGHWLVAPDLHAPSGRETVEIWDTATGEVHDTILTHGQVTFVAFSPDGRWLATANRHHTSREDGRRVKLWDTVTGQLRCSILTEHLGVASVAISPDSTWLATTGTEFTVKCMFDNTVQLWDTRSGRNISTLLGESRVLSVAISPDGTWLAAGEQNGPVRIWDLIVT